MKDEGTASGKPHRFSADPEVTGRTEASRRDLLVRTKRYALAVIKLYGDLPRTAVAQTLGRQILKSGTSPGAQYREAQRAKSNADFVSKIEGALQELEETRYWLELLEGAGIVTAARLEALQTETSELIAILTAIVLKAKSRQR